jgi:hypothetical protein
MPSGVYDRNHKLSDEEKKENNAKAEKKYESSEKGKKYQKEYQQSEKGIEVRRKYESSEKGKGTARKYNQSERGKAKAKKFRLSEKGSPAMRLKVLQYYSKHLSNSDIPCCRCCGINSHTHFLDVDHIPGRSEMNSIPELKKIGYSSIKESGGLHRWLVNNNYLKDLQTEYFQILCKNCNGAKGLYGKCPMENKPHF